MTCSESQDIPPPICVSKPQLITFQAKLIKGLVSKSDLDIFYNADENQAFLDPEIAKKIELTWDHWNFPRFSNNENNHEEYFILTGTYSDENKPTQVFIKKEDITSRCMVVNQSGLIASNTTPYCVENMIFLKKETLRRVFSCCGSIVGYENFWLHDCQVKQICTYCKKESTCLKKHLLEECQLNGVACPLCNNNNKIPLKNYSAHFQHCHSEDEEPDLSGEKLCTCNKCLF